VYEVVESSDWLSHRLIEIFTELDSPRRLPRGKLLQLQKDLGDNNIGARVLDLILLNRLYMFKTTEADMKWLNSKFGYRIKLQHAITYQTNPQRTVS